EALPQHERSLDQLAVGGERVQRFLLRHLRQALPELTVAIALPRGVEEALYRQAALLQCRGQLRARGRALDDVDRFVRHALRVEIRERFAAGAALRILKDGGTGHGRFLAVFAERESERR